MTRWLAFTPTSAWISFASSSSRKSWSTLRPNQWRTSNSRAVLASPFLNFASRSLKAMGGGSQNDGKNGLDFRFRIPDSDIRRTKALWNPESGIQISDSGFQIPDSKSTNQSPLESGIWNPEESTRDHEGPARRRRSRSSVGVRIAPTQRPGRSGAWKSEPATGTSPSSSAQARQRRPRVARIPGPSTSTAQTPGSQFLELD